MRLRGERWLRFLLWVAGFGLYPALRALLIALRFDADLLVECGDHDGRMRFLDLPRVAEDGSLIRPRSRS